MDVALSSVADVPPQGSADSYSAAHRRLDDAVEQAIREDRAIPQWRTEQATPVAQPEPEHRIDLTETAWATARSGFLALHVYAAGTVAGLGLSFASNAEATGYLERLLAAAEEAVAVLRKVVEAERKLIDGETA